MARYTILYWQLIPSQVKAEDDFYEITVPLPERFMTRIDQIAMRDGLTSMDDYGAQWRWSDEEERPGSAQEVAEAVAAELAARTDW